jgi:hypothetical protein
MKATLSLIVILMLTGCAAETTKVVTKPLTRAETQVYNLLLNVATDAGIASVLAEDF